MRDNYLKAGLVNFVRTTEGATPNQILSRAGVATLGNYILLVSPCDSIECMVIPDRLPDEYLIEIGRVSVEWALLESALDLCLIKLAGKEILETRSSIIFNHMAFPMKLDVMGALVSELLPAYPGLAGFPVSGRHLDRPRNTETP